MILDFSKENCHAFPFEVNRNFFYNKLKSFQQCDVPRQVRIHQK